MGSIAANLVLLAVVSEPTFRAATLRSDRWADMPRQAQARHSSGLAGLRLLNAHVVDANLGAAHVAVVVDDGRHAGTAGAGVGAAGVDQGGGVDADAEVLVLLEDLVAADMNLEGFDGGRPRRRG